MIRLSRLTAIREEKEKLHNDEAFQTEVDKLYETIMLENPDFLVAVDELKIHNAEIQKKWKEKNRKKLQEYRSSKEFFYKTQNKCIDCKKLITDRAKRCIECYWKARYGRTGETNNDVPRKEEGGETALPEAIPRVSGGNE